MLFHNDADHTPAALPNILKCLKDEGYEFVFISDLIYKKDYEIKHDGTQCKIENNWHFIILNCIIKVKQSLPCVKGGAEEWGGGIVIEYKHNKTLVNVGRILRKNMTPEERHLWYDFLKTYPIRFNRQKIIGKYIVDFYSAKAKLIIELDGSQHYEENGILKDAERTKFLEQYGFKIIRITNNEIKGNFKGVCEYIDLCVKQSLSQN